MNIPKHKQRFLWLIVGIVLLYGIGMTIVFPLLPFLLGKYLPDSQIVLGMGGLAAVYGGPAGWVGSGTCAYIVLLAESITWPVMFLASTALG